MNGVIYSLICLKVALQVNGYLHDFHEITLNDMVDLTCKCTHIYMVCPCEHLSHKYSSISEHFNIRVHLVWWNDFYNEFTVNMTTSSHKLCWYTATGTCFFSQLHKFNERSALHNNGSLHVPHGSSQGSVIVFQIIMFTIWFESFHKHTIGGWPFMYKFVLRYEDKFIFSHNLPASDEPFAPVCRSTFWLIYFE